MKTTFPFLLACMLLFSCKEKEHSEQSASQSTVTISGNADTLLTDTTWYDQYKGDYEKIAYETLNDEHLKQVLEKHFNLEDDMTYPSYCYEYQGKAVGDSMFIFSPKEGKAKDYEVSIKVKNFDSSHHHFTYTNTHFLYLVDRKIFFGSDGYPPSQEIDSMSVLFKGNKVDLPRSEYSDLYNLYPSSYRPIQVSVDKKTGYLYVIVYGSDAAGSYTAVWIFKDGKYIRRVVEGSC